jgi:hypothetical protein
LMLPVPATTTESFFMRFVSPVLYSESRISFRYNYSSELV